jgi:beta-glucanase (GH16 family)
MRYPKTDLGPRAWPFDAPMFLLLNLAIGGDLGGPVDDTIFPRAMEVDYVRVYQAPR